MLQVFQVHTIQLEQKICFRCFEQKKISWNSHDNQILLQCNFKLHQQKISPEKKTGKKK